jgi:hypothetical protein
MIRAQSIPAMDYMLVCYNDEKHWEQLPRTQQDRIVNECTAYAEELRRSGHLRAAGRLRETASATTVRGDDGKAIVTDGPFAETKEVLAGYYIVTCKDHEEAVKLARENPKLKYGGGSIEVRPLIPAS